MQLYASGRRMTSRTLETISSPFRIMLMSLLIEGTILFQSVEGAAQFYIVSNVCPIPRVLSQHASNNYLTSDVAFTSSLYWHLQSGGKREMIEFSRPLRDW